MSEMYEKGLENRKRTLGAEYVEKAIEGATDFTRDFQLYTRSVVVVDAKDPKRFKVLDRVWQLVGDKAAFQKYVEQEIRAFPRS